MSDPVSLGDKARWRAEVAHARLAVSALRRAGAGVIADLDRAAARFALLETASAPRDADPVAVLAKLLRAHPPGREAPPSTRGGRVPPATGPQNRSLRLVPVASKDATHDRRRSDSATPPDTNVRASTNVVATRDTGALPRVNASEAAAGLADRRAATRAGLRAVRDPLLAAAPNRVFSSPMQAAQAVVAARDAASVGASLASRADRGHIDAESPVPPAATPDGMRNGASVFAAAVARLASTIHAAPGRMAAAPMASALAVTEAFPPDPPPHATATDGGTPELLSAVALPLADRQGEGAQTAGASHVAAPLAGLPAVRVPAGGSVAAEPTAAGGAGGALRLAEEDPLIALAHYHGIDPSWP